MIRTQIQLDERDFARLKQEAARRSVSVSAFVRESVKTALDASDQNAGVSSVRELSGKYHSGKGDLSRNHDAYLNEGW
jgi:hypothetical protein